jgi:hypothetical protein
MGILKLISRFFGSDNGQLVLVGMGIALVMALWPVLQRVPGAWINYFYDAVWAILALLVIGRWAWLLRRNPSILGETLRKGPVLVALKLARVAAIVGCLSLPFWVGFNDTGDGKPSRMWMISPLAILLMSGLNWLEEKVSPRTKAAQQIDLGNPSAGRSGG